jgi:CHASE2 domain-containing sensor protein
MNVIVALCSLIIMRLAPFKAVSCVVTSLAIWTALAYLLFRQGWFVPGVTALFVVVPCVLVISVVSKHTALKARYAQFNALLGGETKIS